MGMIAVQRQGPTSPPVVTFDFDGTLTIRDSFAAFLAWDAGDLRTAAALARIAPAALAYLFDRDRGRMKAAAVRAFLGGRTLASAQAAAEAFAGAARLLRPDAVACWRAWGVRGALRVIVTASPEFVVAPFAASLGADLLIATRLAVDPAGRITGDLDGPNCRGPEKVRRLRDEFGPALRLAAAYGDSAGDREMLAIADEPGMRVFRAKP
jgi:phosphatidylglycerophosphatase C